MVDTMYVTAQVNRLKVEVW